MNYTECTTCVSPETSWSAAIWAIMMGVARRPLRATPGSSSLARDGLATSPLASSVLGSMTNLRKRNWKVAAKYIKGI